MKEEKFGVETKIRGSLSATLNLKCLLDIYLDPSLEFQEKV